MTKWLYREPRGGLKESMATLKKFDSLFKMLDYIATKEKCSINNISISMYDFMSDNRIGWDYTYLVCINNNAIGFCTECDES